MYAATIRTIVAAAAVIVIATAAEAQTGAANIGQKGAASASTISSQVADLLKNITLSDVQKKKIDSVTAWATAEEKKLVGEATVTGTNTASRVGKRHVSIQPETFRDLQGLSDAWPKAVRDLLTPAQQQTWDANRRAIQTSHDARRGAARPPG